MMTMPYTAPQLRPRSRELVENAARRLHATTATSARQSTYNRGALDGYLWALGRCQRPPVTGTPVTARDAPSGARLAIEQRAAHDRAGLDGLCTRVRDYAGGVGDALAWALGQSDLRP